MNLHVSSEILSAYLDGESRPAETRKLEAHLASCTSCRGRLDALRGVARAVERSAVRAAPPAWLATR
ncbi:MAG TPA: zf-HC2 domain-containing protein, partial [Thermoanaerobaculia bacterium]